jgi:hypothetical protein
MEKQLSTQIPVSLRQVLNFALLRAKVVLFVFKKVNRAISKKLNNEEWKISSLFGFCLKIEISSACH